MAAALVDALGAALASEALNKRMMLPSVADFIFALVVEGVFNEVGEMRTVVAGCSGFVKEYWMKR